MYSQIVEENEEDKEGEHLSIGQGRSCRNMENAANLSIGGTKKAVDDTMAAETTSGNVFAPPPPALQTPLKNATNFLGSFQIS